jgi:predicted DNA-binding transcriptional regulator AlpA
VAIDLLTVREVLERTGLHRSMLSRLRDRGRFPEPIHLGPFHIAFPSDRIDQWLKANPKA